MTRVLCVPVYMGACRPAASCAMRGNMSTQQRVRVLENRARAEVQLDSVFWKTLLQVQHHSLITRVC